VTFDPFYDFEERGYLRNVAGEKDTERVKILEHRSFLAKLDQALKDLSRIDHLSYRDVLDTHKTLFGSVYPWAGQDRAQTAPDIAVSKGNVLFAHPDDAKVAVDYALQIGQDKGFMAHRPGEVMGYLAYGHPFLDGNGRTIMVVHSELAQRAGLSLDWAATNKVEYLTALTKEIASPGQGHLDAYLKPFVREAVGRDHLASHIAKARGLDGDPLGPNEVLGRFSDPALQARYAQQEQRREEQIKSASPTPATAAKAALRGNVPPEKQAERDSVREKFTRDSTGDKFTRDLDEGDRSRDPNAGHTRGGGSGGRGRR
jgi:cell filamentation protein